jgi:acyl-coenzyme A thioesterase PaaI-like protein
MYVTRRLCSRATDVKKSIPVLLDFLRLQNRLEEFQGKHGFGDFLGLTVSEETHNNSYYTDRHSGSVCKVDLWWEETGISPYQPALVYRYHLPDCLKFLNVNNENGGTLASNDIQLSTYMSILDEVSTWSMILGTFPHPRPGVSVNMSAEWTCTNKSTHPQKSVDVVTTLTKTGQNIGFLRCDVRDPETSQVLCQFQHTKYLNPDWLFRLLLAPPVRWVLEQASQHLFPYLLNLRTRKQKEMHDNQNILDSFEIIDSSTATFQVRSHHTNGFGGLHGGVQAILMENLGRAVVKQHIPNAKHIKCKRISVSYQSSASRRIRLGAFVVQSQPAEGTIKLRVTVERDKKDVSTSEPTVLVSEGILEYEYQD